MRPINKIIIQQVEVKDTEALIAEHINKREMPEVGFHYLIESGGSIKTGRSTTTIGNHFVGENSNSIGIALIGKELTLKQQAAIELVREELKLKAPEIKDVFIVEDKELKNYQL